MASRLSRSPLGAPLSARRPSIPLVAANKRACPRHPRASQEERSRQDAKAGKETLPPAGRWAQEPGRLEGRGSSIGRREGERKGEVWKETEEEEEEPAGAELDVG